MIELDLVQRWRRFQDWFDKKRRKIAYKLRKNKFPIIRDGNTGEQLNPALRDSVKDNDYLSEREMLLIYEKNECPDCGGQIGWGPQGGMHQNVKCYGKNAFDANDNLINNNGGCGARFNMSLSPMSFPLCNRIGDRPFINEAGQIIHNG